jgi:hypothetical protein
VPITYYPTEDAEDLVQDVYVAYSAKEQFPVQSAYLAMGNSATQSFRLLQKIQGQSR